MSYKKLIAINKLKFDDKKVLIIGAGWMAEQYCHALSAMKVRNVTVVSRKEESGRKCCERYGYKPLHNGYKENLPRLGTFDLVIAATSIGELKNAASLAADCGNEHILVEKPGALYSTVFKEWARENKGARIRIAYNRYTYPSLWKLKELAAEEGGITSCMYTFTEWVHTINFNNNQPEVYERWGIANSLHLISMAHGLIGMPSVMANHREGGLPWHPAGIRFTGSGVTEEEALFAYQADWASAGRWGIEVMTPQNAYRLIPLEKLYRCRKGSVDWEPVEIQSSYPEVKQGVAEEIAVMLYPDLEKEIPLVDLEKAAELTALAEQIFGYPAREERKKDK